MRKNFQENKPKFEPIDAKSLHKGDKSSRENQVFQICFYTLAADQLFEKQNSIASLVALSKQF